MSDAAKARLEAAHKGAAKIISRRAARANRTRPAAAEKGTPADGEHSAEASVVELRLALKASRRKAAALLESHHAVVAENARLHAAVSGPAAPACAVA